MNNNKLSLNSINKNELTKYIPSLRANKLSYISAVNSVDKHHMNKLTMKLQPFTKAIPRGHPTTAATGIFLAKQHSQLGTALRNEQMGVLCANNTTMDSATTRQLNLSPDLQSNA